MELVMATVVEKITTTVMPDSKVTDGTSRQVMQSQWQQGHSTVATAGDAQRVGDSDVTCDRQQEHGHSNRVDDNSIPV